MHEQAYLNKLISFTKNKRGFYALLLVLFITLLCPFLELLINNRALVVSYNDQLYFPAISGFYSEAEFGGEAEYEADYRKLAAKFEQAAEGNWLILPLVPFNAFESDFSAGAPAAPSLASKHYLGTDLNGRDIVSRLAYGYRQTIFFALSLYILNTISGLLIGSLMGYLGGWFDLIMQRLVEIWSNLPVLYILIILGSFITPNIYILLITFAILNWTGISWLIRAEVLREKRLRYVDAAVSIGASKTRIIVVHLLPNCLVPIIANFPFQIIGAIGVLTSLDYLGYGLPLPTPSWGELIRQGEESFEYAPWIVISPISFLVLTLLAFSFVGEALRDVFDPQKNIRYI